MIGSLLLCACTGVAGPMAAAPTASAAATATARITGDRRRLDAANPELFIRRFARRR
jgi:hypothetical protein